jgi:hypothetical protein
MHHIIFVLIFLYLILKRLANRIDINCNRLQFGKLIHLFLNILKFVLLKKSYVMKKRTFFNART